MDGLGLGAGVRYVGSSFGDNANTPVLDNKARTFVDAAISYDFGKLNTAMEGVKLQVNATVEARDVWLSPAPATRKSSMRCIEQGPRSMSGP